MPSTQEFRRRLVLALSLLIGAVCCVERVAAENLPTYLLRELVAKSEEIVIARPAETGRVLGKDVKFVASEVLKGRRIRVGETFTVPDLSLYHLESSPLGPRTAATRPRDCRMALLFLNPKRNWREQQEVAGQFELCLSGIRLLTDDAKVLLPLQFMNPGDYYFVVAKSTTWMTLLDQVKDDVKAIAAVFALKDIADPAQRNGALFTWIEEHRKEFNGRYFLGHQQELERGWGSLEHDVFGWIIDGDRPEDAWRAVKLWRQVDKHPFGIGPVRRPDTFASSEGRRILLRVAIDPEEPIEDRQSAVYRLAFSLYNKPPEARQMEREEYLRIKAAALTLLKHDDPQLRRFASELASNLESVKSALRIDPRPRETLDAVIEAYRRQPPGRGRTEMAANIIAMGGEYVWQQVSGNPEKILVNLQNVQVRSDLRGSVIRLTIFQSIHQRAGDLFKAGTPVAVMEKLAAEERGERHVLRLASFASASSGDEGPWIAEVPAETLSRGRWQVTIVGKVDAVDDYEWCSEPATLDVE